MNRCRAGDGRAVRHVADVVHPIKLDAWGGVCSRHKRQQRQQDSAQHDNILSAFWLPFLRS